MPQPTDQRERELLKLIEHTGTMQENIVAIPGTGVSLRVWRPASIDQLLDMAESDPEQNLPYWSELWPSGIALAELLYLQPELVKGKRVIELGCGLGITAAIAFSAGAELIATDYASEALTLTRLTCLNHTGREPETVRVNWRDGNEPLLNGSQTFPVILAADVLYERRDVQPLLDLLERLLAKEGLILLAEPGRIPARMFLERAHQTGWQSESSTWLGPWPDPKDEGVRVRIHKLTRVRRDSKP